MKLFNLIIGVVFLALGVYLTLQGWSAAPLGRLESGVYVGPFLAVMGFSRILRGISLLPPNVMFRYIALGIAVAVGYGDRAVVHQMYPDAVSTSLNIQH
jgi:predicted phage tail protein